MREKFEDRKLTGKIEIACKFENAPTRVWETTKEEVISHIKQIVSAYKAEGYVLTLRQLHYQLVSRNWIVNHDSAYKKLGDILDDCRYSGVIDWNMIEDRGRRPYIEYAVRDIEHALQDTVDQYKLDRQTGQTNCVELWTEKDALSGIFSRTTDKYHIRLVVNKGYTSSSALYRAYERIVRQLNSGNKVTILYFGDHDPSGLDMVRDIRERLMFFLCNGDGLSSGDFDEKMLEWWNDNEHNIYTLLDKDLLSDKFFKEYNKGDDLSEESAQEFEAARRRLYIEENELFRVNHIGLTMEQIKQYKLPANPTKLTDSRASGYIAKYGKTSWEVDALSPEQLTDLVEQHIQEEIDIQQFTEMIKLENEQIEKLRGIIDNLENIL